MAMKKRWSIGEQNIQRQLRKKNEDIQLFGEEYSLVWSGGVGLPGRQQTRRNKNEVREMDSKTRLENT